MCQIGKAGSRRRFHRCRHTLHRGAALAADLCRIADALAALEELLNIFVLVGEFSGFQRGSFRPAAGTA